MNYLLNFNGEKYSETVKKLFRVRKCMKNLKSNIAVVAIGGNALSAGLSTIKEQTARAQKAANLVKMLVNHNLNVVVVHGNGPQVGVAYLKELAGLKENLPPLNLAYCDALTQAEIGSMLELAIINSINAERPDFEVLTIVTQVEVKKDDPAFRNPVKPVGPFYSRHEIKELHSRFPDWVIKHEPGRGYRRVVPSPAPVKVFASSSIPDAFRTAQVIIAGGGGGIPVVRNPDNTFDMVDAVVDKDKTAVQIALDIGASFLFMLTGVPQVAVNFGKPEQAFLSIVTVDQMKKYLAQGHFPPGSMGPKVEAAIRFVEGTGGEAIITDSQHIEAALARKAGTVVVGKYRQLELFDFGERA